MKRDVAVVIGLSLALLSCSGGGGTPPASPPRAAAPAPTPEPGARPLVDRVTPLPQPLPEIVAEVNGKPIFLRTIRVLVNVFGNWGDGRVGAENPAAYRNAVQRGIERELLIQEADRRKIVADDAAMERHYNDVLMRYKGDKPWAEALDSVAMDPEAYRNYLRVTYTIHALRKQMEAEAPYQVTDQEAQAIYDANPRNFMSDPQPSRHLAFGEAKERVKKQIASKKRGMRDYSFLKSLRARAKIETYL